MTERDAVKQVVEQSITTKVDIEVLRKWAKEMYSGAIEIIDARDFHLGRAAAFAEMIKKLDEMEAMT